MPIFTHSDHILTARTELYKSSKYFSHLPEATLKTTIKEELDSLEELAQESVALKRHEFFQIPNTSPNDFCERELEIEEGGGQYFIAE